MVRVTNGLVKPHWHMSIKPAPDHIVMDFGAFQNITNEET